MLRRAAVELALIAFVIGPAVHAEDPVETARIHIAAIGGRERIAALTAYRATGRLRVGNQTSGLTVIAARPDRLRVEIRRHGRTTIQVSDGRNPPWQAETAGGVTRTVAMTPAAQEAFRSAAEFDDPLTGAEAYGYEFDDAGIMPIDGHSFRRLLVTQRLTKTFYLLIDPATYFIVARIDQTGPNAPSEMVTRYDDVRPVAGVLLPHRITVLLNREPARVAVLDYIEPNPALPAGTFTLPAPP